MRCNQGCFYNYDEEFDDDLMSVRTVAKTLGYDPCNSKYRSAQWNQQSQFAQERDDFDNAVMAYDEETFETAGKVIGGVLLSILLFGCCFCCCLCAGGYYGYKKCKKEMNDSGTDVRDEGIQMMSTNPPPAPGYGGQDPMAAQGYGGQDPMAAPGYGAPPMGAPPTYPPNMGNQQAMPVAGAN